MVNTDSFKDIGLGSNTTDILIRTPVIKDGMAVHNLIANCPPLDTNSSYCNAFILLTLAPLLKKMATRSRLYPVTAIQEKMTPYLYGK